MLIREVTYTNIDGETVTEPFHFNLTRAEVIEMQVSYKGGLGEAMQRILRTKDTEQIVALIKKLILTSYGIRSDDGKHFQKSEEIRQNFVDCFAYDALFMELTNNDESAATFLKGIMPKEVREDIAKAEAELAKNPGATQRAAETLQLPKV
jgi:hypothetical protein